VNAIETKVWAAIAGGVGGGALVTLVLWMLGVSIWHVSDTASSSAAATAAVPPAVANVLILVVPAVLAGVAGWLAPHTPRAVAASSYVTVSPVAQSATVTLSSADPPPDTHLPPV
jgi:hypothetical protein